jgi:hypothetical protein
MAVMMMVAMSPRIHSSKIKKIAFGVNHGFFLPYFKLFWHCGFQVRISVDRVHPRAGVNPPASEMYLIA